MSKQYDNIYFNQSRAPGQVRLTESGLGWKAHEQKSGGSASTKVSAPFLLPAEDMTASQWSRGARGYMLKFQTRSHSVVQLDGFDQDDFNRLKTLISDWFSLSLEPREHSVRGWNWGSVEFERNELVFDVSSRPFFEIPYSSVSNSNTVGKSEVAVEFNVQPANQRTTGGDELVEMRFYVPTLTAEEAAENGDDAKPKTEGESDAEEEIANAAEQFHEQLREKADLGLFSGSELATFEDIMFSTPRGRYDIDLYDESFKLRGKSYDYKLAYSTIQRIFVLPKPDDLNNLVILQLDPPMRQGQTRYPFVVMQFVRDEKLQVELNVDEEEFEKKYGDRLDRTYEDASYQVISNLYKGLSNRRITFAGSFISSRSQPCVLCSLKANEGTLYILEKALLFVSKSTIYIPFTEISSVRFSRLAEASSASRTFDMQVNVRNSAAQQFASVEREEQVLLDAYFRGKNITTVDDSVEERKKLEAALADMGSDVDMAGGSQDEESEDEDFNDEGESDPAEEFDSDAEDDSASGASDAGSDDEDESEMEDSEESDSAKKRPAKRTKR